MAETDEIRQIKEEIGQLSTRMDDISGCFDNFDTTLNNHMTDYKTAQTAMAAEQVKIRDMVTAMALTVAKLQGSEGLAITLIKWVIVPLIGILAALIGVKLMVPGVL